VLIANGFVPCPWLPNPRESCVVTVAALDLLPDATRLSPEPAARSMLPKQRVYGIPMTSYVP
jgi:hypothetical protein